MFLTAVYVFRPVAGVSVLVVEKAAYAQLLRGGPVPAGPVPGARGLVPKNAIQPITVLPSDWSVCKRE